MTSHEEWMRAALREADLAAEAGDVPVGAIVVSAEGHEIARGRNRREVDQDPTAHAEVVALRNAALATGHWRLEGSTVYVTLEPCPMCAGAVINARVRHVVYGALQSLYNLGNDLRLNHRFDSTPGVLDAECVDRLRTFFAKLRAAGEK